MISKNRSVHKKKELTPEEKDALRIKARRQFKAGYRLVLNNIYWYTNTATKKDKRLFKLGRPSQSILTAKTIKNLLTLPDKILFKKHPSLRTTKELTYMHLLLSNTKLFRLYPEEVRVAVTEYIFFGYYEAGRMLIREGGEPTMMFILISGEIKLFGKSFDPVLNTKILKYVKTCGPGTIFGEMDILNNTPRKYTIHTATPIEFLYITKDDLNRVLDTTVRHTWNTIKSYITEIPYFDQYNMEDIQEVIITSKILEFNADEVILGHSIGLSSCSHIIIDGQCRLIETLMITPEWDKKKQHFKNILYDGDATTNFSPNVEIHYMQICIMNVGSIFNVGENLQNRSVVSITPVKCFCIPNYLLLKRNIWILLKEQLNKHIPSSKKVFNIYLNHKKWLKYRQQLQDDILAKHYIPSYNSISNLSPTYR